MKKRKKIRIKTSNTIKIALTIFVVVLCIYLISFYPKEEEIKQIEIEAPVEITTPEIPITTTIEKTKVDTFISDLKCVNGDIMMTFTNILDKKKKISDFTFFVAGKVNRGVICDLTELQPGQSTFCRNINGGIRFRDKVLIAVGYPAHYEKAVVDCKKSRITANIMFDIKNFFKRLFGY